jgi:hypothetical protein
MDISLIATWLKRLGAICLALVILWHVSHRAAPPRRGKAIVHVLESNVSVIVDRLEFLVPSLSRSPIVCELDAGLHLAQVWRNGVLLAEERFVVEPGGEVVISPALQRPEPTAAAGGPSGPSSSSPPPARLVAGRERLEARGAGFAARLPRVESAEVVP